MRPYFLIQPFLLRFLRALCLLNRAICFFFGQCAFPFGSTIDSLAPLECEPYTLTICITTIPLSIYIGFK
uniref:Secreted protein n=1 Tax=Anopheles darlingi TaxID=43151 RepID=A0A2M4D968_ANODA